MPDHENIPLNKEALDLRFLDEGSAASLLAHRKCTECYQIVIADDEEEVHKMTKLVLKGFEMEGVKLQFFDTYSGRETIEFLNENRNVAIVLLDIVMEEDDSGLQVIRYLRETLKNNLTRVVVRTGQPGKAPEEKIVVEYEVDDYKSKTELTVQKLYSTMHLCLRAHRNIKELSHSKDNLFRVINASQELFKFRSFSDFMKGMLQQIIALYDLDEALDGPGGLRSTIDSFAAIQMADTVKVLAATGKYEGAIQKPLGPEICSPELLDLIETVSKGPDSEAIFRQGDTLLIFKRSADKHIRNYVVLETELNPENIELIQLFLDNFSLAIDNFMLNMNTNETQNEIIFRISEIVENRSDATANHLRRVSNIARVVASKLHYEEEMCNTIMMASVMHDVGKIGISDEILLKPAKLTQEEFETIKKHTTIGYSILKDSRLKLLNMAATIALYHHERYDGMGYPTGKKEDEIPKECQIVAVADVFDALISKRCYKQKWPLNDVMEYMRQSRGTQFSPPVVDALLGSIDEVLNIIRVYPD